MENQQLIKYRPLIFKKALLYHYAYGLELKDCYQEAYALALESLRRYDPSKGSLCTYLFIGLTGRLKDYGKKEKKERRRFYNSLRIHNFYDSYNKEKEENEDNFHLRENKYYDKSFEQIEFLNYLSNQMSKSAWIVINILFDKSTDKDFNKIRLEIKKYNKVKSQNRITKDLLMKYLQKKGWRVNEIKRIFKEIEKALYEWRGEENALTI